MVDVRGGGVGLRYGDDVKELSGYAVKQNSAYVSADSDKDEIKDMYDNCIIVFNPLQKDVYQNGQGDACDDFDNDGIMNAQNNCASYSNPNQKDTDADGVGDRYDDKEDRLTERNPIIPWVGMGIAALVLIGLFATSVKTARMRVGNDGVFSDKNDVHDDVQKPEL